MLGTWRGYMLGTWHAEYLVLEREGPSHVGVFTWKDLIGSVGIMVQSYGKYFGYPNFLDRK